MTILGYELVSIFPAKNAEFGVDILAEKVLFGWRMLMRTLRADWTNLARFAACLPRYVIESAWERVENSPSSI